MSDNCSCGHPKMWHALGGCCSRRCQCCYYMTPETRTFLWKLMGWGKENQTDE